MSQTRARLFVALELPDQVTQTLEVWQQEALAEVPGLRLINGRDLHVTLCFLGWQAAESIPGIAEACAVAGTQPAARLALEEAIWLPPRRPRVLAVRLTDSGGLLAGVQARLAAALEQGGWYQPERRPFLPHVTVARVPGTRGLRTAGPVRPPSTGFSGDRVTLFRSHLARGGARYEPLVRIRLADPIG